MDTTTYFFAAYAVFWLLPMVYVYRLLKQVKGIEQKLDRALQSLEQA